MPMVAYGRSMNLSSRPSGSQVFNSMEAKPVGRLYSHE